MKTKDFEKVLQKLDPNLRLVDVRAFGVNDVVGVYWNHIHLAACPSEDVYPERMPEYKNEYGDVHRSMNEIISICKNFLEEMRNDKEFYDLMQEE